MLYPILGTLLIYSSIIVSPALAQAPEIVDKPVAIQMPTRAPVRPVARSSTPSPYIQSLIDKESAEHGVNAQDIYDTISCESSFKTDVQSYYYHNGKREESYGLSQINLPSHPNVSYEQAIDPEFAVHFIAYQFSIGNQHHWSCWTKKHPNGS